MNVKDIIDMEKANFFGIILLKEGIFYRAYNRSAMRISTKIRAFKVNVKFIKYIGQAIMYCGFPENILPQIRDACLQRKYNWHERGEARVDIECVAEDGSLQHKETMPGEDYEGWAGAILKREVSEETGTYYFQSYFKAC